jgi:hypothetical protein
MTLSVNDVWEGTDIGIRQCWQCVPVVKEFPDSAHRAPGSCDYKRPGDPPREHPPTLITPVMHVKDVGPADAAAGYRAEGN